MDIKRNKIVGQCLKEARKHAGLSQAVLGKRLKKAQSLISKQENGDRSFPLAELFDYVEALDSDTTYLELVQNIYVRLDEEGYIRPVHMEDEEAAR